MILSQAQAEAVYSAMAALNNVAGRIECSVGEAIRVAEMVSGSIFVSTTTSDMGLERYADQAAFAAAYNLS